MSEELKTAPTLVVVGRVNRGKSSILSTLAEDDSVLVSPDPGTTTEVHYFPLRVDGEVILQLADTPGFEDAHRALALMKEQEESAATRREAVESFCRRFAGTSEFAQERKLLRPILNGGAILYVVDGSAPYRRNYEAEMEILRWTGQPRMALINRTGERDHTEEWRCALDQFFSVVRTFNAHSARFGDRMALLRTLREIKEEWRPAFDRAVQALELDWNRRFRVSARILSRMISAALTHTRTIVLEPGDDASMRRTEIERDFHDDLRGFEQSARKEIEAVYLHRALQRHEAEISRPVLDQDLFSRETWKTLGLSFKQLLALGVVSGAATGGALDLLLGGSSLAAGTALGGLLGGGAAVYFGSSRLASVADIGRFIRGGRKLVIGPHRNPNFPWVLLDRALLHYVSVRDRAHGKRDPLDLLERAAGAGGERLGLVSHFPEGERKELGKIFARMQKRREPDEMLERQLEDRLERLLPGLDVALPPNAGSQA